MRKMKHTGKDSFIYTDKFVVFGYEYEYRYTVTGLGRSLTNPKLVIELLRGGKKLAPKQTIDVNVDHLTTVFKALARKHNKVLREARILFQSNLNKVSQGSIVQGDTSDVG